MNTRKSFLVFSGGNDRAVLAFLRALSLCGHNAYIVARTHSDRILRTHFSRDVVLVRGSHELTPDLFFHCLEKVRLTSGDQELIILPSSEYFNAFLLRHRDHIERSGCQIPLVDARTYSLLTEKRSSTDYFSAGGITVPTEYSAPGDRQLPMVAKPLYNIDRRGRSLYPALLHTIEDVQNFTATNAIEDFFFQEYVHGPSRYLFVYISRDHKHVITWSQRNLLQQPNGKSMLFASPDELHNDPIAQRIIDRLHATNFVGLGMVELIQDKGRTVFIEMNPRIWGPIQFCLDQHQPLLQAFVGDCLHGDPLRYTTNLGNQRRAYYFWLGGLLETLASHSRPIWHAERVPWLKLIGTAIRNDVFIRMDSWRCFLFEAARSLIRAAHVNRT
jgi:hypothetical protein